MPPPARKPLAEERISIQGADGRAIQAHVVRSARRVKSIGIGWAGLTLLEVRAPVAMSMREIEQAIVRLLPRLERLRARRPMASSDATLEERARQLNVKFFAGKLAWQSIRYVSNQRRRYGSCTPGEGTIRISDQIQAVPSWVRDYVLIHELAHLQEPNHSPAFWALVNRYPLAERARGFLLGMAHAGHLPHEEDDDANGA